MCKDSPTPEESVFTGLPYPFENWPSLVAEFEEPPSGLAAAETMPVIDRSIGLPLHSSWQMRGPTSPPNQRTTLSSPFAL